MIITNTIRDVDTGAGVSGVTVTLKLAADDSTLDTDTTDANGVFSFELEYPGPVYWEATAGGKTIRHSSDAIMPVDTLDLSAIVPFQRTWSNGVGSNYGTDLEVTAAGSTMNVSVGVGAAIINGRAAHYTTATTLTVETAHATLPRIDSVILQYLASTGAFSLEIIKGTAASVPVAPRPSSDPLVEAITQATAPYILLADIRVDAAVSSIASNKVTDRRTFSAPSSSAGLLLEDDNVSKGQAPGLDVKAPLTLTYYDTDTVADLGVTPFPLVVGSDSDTSTASMSSGTTTLCSFNLTLVNNRQYQIWLTGVMSGQGVGALTTGQLQITVDGGAAVTTPVLTIEHGVDSVITLPSIYAITGDGGPVPIVLQWVRTTGTCSRNWAKLAAVAIPTS